MIVSDALDAGTSILRPASRAARVKKSEWASHVCTTSWIYRSGRDPDIGEHGSIGPLRDPSSDVRVSFILLQLYARLRSMITVWFGAITLFRGHEEGVLGSGTEECRRVAHASFALFGTVAIVSYLLKLELARGYLAVALPLGLTTLLLTRHGLAAMASQ